MPKLDHQVLFKILKSPIMIAFFHNDGIDRGHASVKQADELREQLNKAGIQFAAVNQAPPIKIFIGKNDATKLKELEKSGKIKLPTVFDSWGSR